MNDSLKFSILIAVGLASFVVFVLLSMREDNIEQFIVEAEHYQVSYDRYESIIHIPGSGSNRSRHEVNSLLSYVLMGEMPNTERSEVSKKALNHIDVLDSQVSDITTGNSNFISQGDVLIESAKIVHGHQAEEYARNMTEVVDNRVLYIEELSTILLNMNTKTRSIFERVITDGGEMTDDHVRELNNHLNGAEQEYDRLSYIYNELERFNGEFENDFFEIRVLKNK